MNGILPLFKPKGMTSHDCVAKLRRILGTKKVGHTGTLDPDVCGVLPICVGNATKIVQFLMETSKTYEAEINLGTATTTEDASGEVIERKQIVGEIEETSIKDVVHNFHGTITQVPPMYSAVKVNGKRLYEYARNGIEVERPERTIHIYEITLLNEPIILNEQKNTFRVRVTCSKGTYIRTLAVDIGKELGYPAHMSDLIRTASGGIVLEDCLTFEEIEEKMKENSLVLISIEEALSFMPTYSVDLNVEEKIRNGAVLAIPKGYEKETHIVMVNEKKECIAIYQHHPSKPGLIKPVKVFH